MAGPKDGGERRDKEDHYRRAALVHPVRRRILRLMLNGTEANAAEIAAELAEMRNRVAYHLRVLARRRALKGVAKDRPAAPCYRLAPQTHWARKILAEFGKEDGRYDSGGRD